MSVLNRNPNNPLLRPNPDHEWEAFAAFNGSIIASNDRYILCYRAMSYKKQYQNKSLHLSIIGKAESSDGIAFSHRVPFIQPQEPWEQYGCEDPRITRIDHNYYIFYTALGNYPPNHQHIKAAVAISPDMQTISERHLVTPFNAKAMTIFPEKINGKYTVILSVNTDKPPVAIACAQFETIETLWDQDFWRSWYGDLDKHTVNLRRINSDQVEIGASPIKTPYGWLLIYSYIKNYFSPNKTFRIESVLLDYFNPTHVIGRLKEPCLIPEAVYELEGRVQSIVFPESAIVEGDDLHVYYGGADTYCCRASANLTNFMQRFDLNAPYAPKCEKFPHNPLLLPVENHPWESKGVLNPAVVALDGKTYLVYRAFGENNQSTLGMAISNDGLFIDERIGESIFPISEEWDASIRDAHSAGCEDARITRLDNTLYMCYTAFDGKLPRLALSSITIDDFINRAWRQWTQPKIISLPNLADKDGCLFPEKVNDRYVFLHRIEPNIVIDFTDDLDFVKKPFLGCTTTILPGFKIWDGEKIGINTVPLKTKAGWLMMYHGISKIDRHYRVGALLLDLHDVTKVIGRTPYPILEPELYFEREGVVANVVFPCGHMVKDEELYLYYGGADRVVCGAKISLPVLLNDLLESSYPRYLKMSQGII